MQRTITVRPIGFEEALRLTTDDLIYVTGPDGRLKAAHGSVAANHKGEKKINKARTAAPDETGTYRVVGHTVTINYATADGSHSGATIPDDREAIIASGSYSPDAFTTKAYVKDPDGVEMPLVGVAGTYVTLKVYREGYEGAPQALADAFATVVREQYSDVDVRVAKGRHVSDERVNIETSRGEVLAVGVLDAFSSEYAGGRGMYCVTHLGPETQIG